MPKQVLTVLDVENSFAKREKGRDDASPYNASNRLVSIGWSVLDNKTRDPIKSGYHFFYHNDMTDEQRATAAASFETVQKVLSETTVLIGHNLKHDIQWLLESGFAYERELYCTMIGEYILARGLKVPLSLAESVIRRGVGEKRTDLTEDFLDRGVGFEEMPMAVVEEYGRADVDVTGKLYKAHMALYEKPENAGLVPIRSLTNEFTWVLVDMARSGIKIDLERLDEIEKEFQTEQNELQIKLNGIVHQLNGDRPVNLDSPEQLSAFVYSREVMDKEKWAETFNLGKDERGKDKRRPRMTPKEFAEAVKSGIRLVRKTKACVCSECQGKGKVFKTKKSGDAFKKPNKCKTCEGAGVTYEDAGDYGGLRCTPLGIEYVTAGGFSTDKSTLEELKTKITKREGRFALAYDFLDGMIRLNAISTYLSSFVGGIRRGIQADGFIHPNFNQCVTSTGRLSSSDPNFQNMPRAKTFPVRRCVVSRFPDGVIMEADFASLEFVIAGLLSGDKVIYEDIKNKFDVHSFTAKVLTEAGEPRDRQGAKPDTFKPLYGGSSGTPAQMAYYAAFKAKYQGLAKWQARMMDDAINNKKIVTPTGREYAFPGAERMRNGKSTFATQIVNYPVQGVATGDFVPLANVRLRRLMRQEKLKAVMINTVHDSIVSDVPIDEVEKMIELYRYAMTQMDFELIERFGINLDIPLRVEIKSGPSWLEGKVCYVSP